MKFDAIVRFFEQSTISRRSVWLLTAIGLALMPAAKSQTVNPGDQIIPLIQFSDVPITTAIENLARQSGFNYIIDPKLFPISESTPEPLINFRVKDETAKEVLTRMLDLRGIAMTDDAVTHVVRITRRGKVLSIVNASLLNAETNTPSTGTNAPIPLIQFQAVPLDVALENLIRQCGVKLDLDPRITESGPTDRRLVPYPMLSMRWTDITPKQALIALCQNYDLTIEKDSVTGIPQIKPKDVKRTRVP